MDQIKIQPVPENLEPVKQITSEQWTINWRDIGKGALIAVVTAIIAAAIEGLNEGGLDKLNFVSIGTAALSALLAYLAKQFTDPTKTVRTYKKAETPTNQQV